ncbi:hypothetical protein ISF_07351 [Cordyceps fumosorosea ARSEF 2679]|uniref:Uncharacterized protein n=1 Tax=Cordyceps fumosorosea (strain ARSEF 2679) TaxID=1081104 RepID=A0A162IGI4_CORFA|nr:hypothetical protein ISF_07351 [Cordyceps fumosorosea ARSEF 2679]OAA56835.1 hypothetical protein ISF_07351 [Cordyceps fumosorosea ARSEF 2679]
MQARVDAAGPTRARCEHEATSHVETGLEVSSYDVRKHEINSKTKVFIASASLDRCARSISVQDPVRGPYLMQQTPGRMQFIAGGMQLGISKNTDFHEPAPTAHDLASANSWPYPHAPRSATMAGKARADPAGRDSGGAKMTAVTDDMETLFF